jgi:hypothetical protein
MPGFGTQDPQTGVDAEFFPYVVVPPVILQHTTGHVLGSSCTVTNTKNGMTCEAVVADIGPSKQDGEGSPALCRALGLSGDPKSGGTSENVIQYDIHVGVPANINGVTFILQPA